MNIKKESLVLGMIVFITLSVLGLVLAQNGSSEDLSNICKESSVDCKKETTIHGSGYEVDEEGDIKIANEEGEIILNKGSKNEIKIEGTKGVELSDLNTVYISGEEANVEVNGNSFENLERGSLMEINRTTGKITGGTLGLSSDSSYSLPGGLDFDVPAGSRNVAGKINMLNLDSDRPGYILRDSKIKITNRPSGIGISTKGESGIEISDYVEISGNEPSFLFKESGFYSTNSVAKFKKSKFRASGEKFFIPWDDAEVPSERTYVMEEGKEKIKFRSTGEGLLTVNNEDVSLSAKEGKEVSLEYGEKINMDSSAKGKMLIENGLSRYKVDENGEFNLLKPNERKSGIQEDVKKPMEISIEGKSEKVRVKGNGVVEGIEDGEVSTEYTPKKKKFVEKTNEIIKESSSLRVTEENFKETDEGYELKQKLNNGYILEASSPSRSIADKITNNIVNKMVSKGYGKDELDKIDSNNDGKITQKEWDKFTENIR